MDRFRGRVRLEPGVPYLWELVDRDRGKVVAWGEEFTMASAMNEARVAAGSAEVWHVFKRSKSEHYRAELD